MSKYQFTTMAFQEGGSGSLTDIVGKKSLFRDKEDFLHWLTNESEEFEEEFKSHKKTDIPKLKLDNIHEGYVRYFPHFGEDSGMEIESGYTYCGKGKGAFEVYYIKF